MVRLLAKGLRGDEEKSKESARALFSVLVGAVSLARVAASPSERRNILAAARKAAVVILRS